MISLKNKYIIFFVVTSLAISFQMIHADCCSVVHKDDCTSCVSSAAQAACSTTPESNQSVVCCSGSSCDNCPYVYQTKMCNGGKTQVSALVDKSGTPVTQVPPSGISSADWVKKCKDSIPFNQCPNPACNITVGGIVIGSHSIQAHQCVNGAVNKSPANFSCKVLGYND